MSDHDNKDLEIEALSDDDLESVSGGDTYTGAGAACSTTSGTCTTAVGGSCSTTGGHCTNEEFQQT